MWPNSITSFLRELGGTVSVVFIRPDHGPMDARTSPCWALSEIEDHYLAISNNGFPVNAYYMLNEPRPGLPSNKRKMTKADISAIRGCWVDVDAPAGTDSMQAKVAAIVDRFACLPEAEKPTCLVMSGGGVQALYLFDQAIDAASDNVSRAEAVNRALIKRFSGDPGTWNSDRFLRLPFTVNHPDENKRAKGRTGPVDALIHEWTGRRFTLEELEELFPPIVEHQRTSDRTTEGIDLGFTDYVEDYQDLPGSLRDRLEEERARFKDFDELWKGKRHAGADTSGSGMLAALAYRLRKAGFTSSEIAQVAHVWPPCWGSSKAKNLSERSLKRVIANADALLDEFVNGQAYAPDYTPWPNPDLEPPGAAPPPGQHSSTRASEEQVHCASGSAYTDYGADAKVEPLPFDTRDLALLADEPIEPREFLDGHKLILMGAVHVLNGDGGIGKTELAIQLMIGCSGFGAFLNLPVRQGPVLFFSAEEPEMEVRRQLDHLCIAFNIHLSDLVGVHLVDATGQPAWLFEATRDGKLLPTKLWRRLIKTVEHIKPVCLVMDNRARIFAGNQSDTVLATATVIELDALARRFGCAVVLLSHPSLSGMSSGRGDSGSVAWSNAARSRSYLHHPDKEHDLLGGEDDGRRRLTNMKANYSRAGVSIDFAWDKGLNYFRCTFVPPRAGDDIGQAEKAERVFLKLLRWHEDHGLPVSPLSRSGNYFVTLFGKMSDSMRERVNTRRFYGSMQALLEARTIEIYEIGPPSRRTKLLRMAVG